MNKMIALFAAASSIAACGSNGDNEDTGAPPQTMDDGSTSVGVESEGDDSSGSGGAPTECANPSDNSARVGIGADIDGGTTLTCDTIWVLEEIVFVRGGTLTIEPGTTIVGTEGSALVIDRDATIIAEGTPDAPIVMTSIQPQGSRSRGDWGGLVMLGSATTNLEGGVGTAEGFASAPTYGGQDDADDCGSLAYLRVEWAGFAIAEGSELNGITFYACGSETSMHHVQVHMGADDGIEMFGGSFDADHIIVTGAEDDSVDCDQGYRGTLSHVFIHQDPAVGDNAFEWSNQGVNIVAEPLTSPTVCNGTMVGSGAGGDNSKGATLKEGTEAGIYNSVFADFTNELFFLQNIETQRNAEEGAVIITGNVYTGNGVVGVDSEGDVTWSVDDFQMFLDDNMNVSADPMLGSADWGDPNIMPAQGSPLETSFVAGGGCPQTGYVGAIEPGGENWTAASWVNYAI